LNLKNRYACPLLSKADDLGKASNAGSACEIAAIWLRNVLKLLDFIRYVYIWPIQTTRLSAVIYHYYHYVFAERRLFSGTVETAMRHHRHVRCRTADAAILSIRTIIAAGSRSLMLGDDRSISG